MMSGVRCGSGGTDLAEDAALRAVRVREKSLRLDWTLSEESSGVQSSRSPAPASESELDAMPRGAAE